MSLTAQLVGAKIIVSDPDSGLVLAWHGGHGIHAYDAQGVEVGFWNVGDWSKDHASEGRVRSSMAERIRRGTAVTE